MLRYFVSLVLRNIPTIDYLPNGGATLAGLGHLLCRTHTLVVQLIVRRRIVQNYIVVEHYGRSATCCIWWAQQSRIWIQRVLNDPKTNINSNTKTNFWVNNYHNQLIAIDHRHIHHSADPIWRPSIIRISASGQRSVSVAHPTGIRLRIRQRSASHERSVHIATNTGRRSKNVMPWGGWRIDTSGKGAASGTVDRLVSLVVDTLWMMVANAVRRQRQDFAFVQ